MKFCKQERCRWYGNSSKHGRKCYYEAQCILGWLDTIISIVKLRFQN